MSLTTMLSSGFVMLLVAAMFTTSSYADTNDELLMRVQDSFLSKLNMKTRPRPDRSKVFIPTKMKELYQAQLSNAVWDVPGTTVKPARANTVKSYFTADKKSLRKFSKMQDAVAIYFNVSSLPAHEVFRSAELILSRTELFNATAEWQEVRVIVNEITQPGSLRDIDSALWRPIDSMEVPAMDRPHTTISLDIRPAVERWLQNASLNHGLLIEVREDKGKKIAHNIRLKIKNRGHKKWIKEQPVMLMYTDDTTTSATSRTKRHTHGNKRSAKKGGENCQRHTMYVNFEKVGWNDWIVAPPGYDAFYCAGSCPHTLSASFNTTNHAVIQNIMHYSSDSKIPKPCCVPTELSSISMLYLDEDHKVVLKNYKDMTVIGCGCR